MTLGKKKPCSLHVRSTSVSFLSMYTEAGSDTPHTPQHCALQVVLAALFCLGSCGHRHRFPFTLIMKLPPLKGFTRLLCCFLFLLGLCSFAKEIGSKSDHALFLLSAFFSSLCEVYHVVHSFVTFPFVQRVQMNLTF